MKIIAAIDAPDKIDPPARQKVQTTFPPLKAATTNDYSISSKSGYRLIFGTYGKTAKQSDSLTPFGAEGL